MSSIGSVTYDVSKHIAGLLSNLVGKSAYHVKDTNSFVGDLKDVTIENDEFMVSFDVEALFTSVPVHQHACVYNKLLMSFLAGENCMLSFVRICSKITLYFETYVDESHLHYEQTTTKYPNVPMFCMLS